MTVKNAHYQTFFEKLLKKLKTPSFLKECLLLIFPLVLFFTLRHYISNRSLFISLLLGGALTTFHFRSRRPDVFKEYALSFAFFTSIFLFIAGFWGLYDIDTLRRYADTFVYDTYSKTPLSNIHFWFTGGRPFLTALVFKIFQRDFATINNFYITIYLGAVILSIASITRLQRSLHDKLLSGYLLILLFLNQHTIAFWVTNAMSETLSIASTMLTIALFAFVTSSRRQILLHPGRGYLTLGGIFLTTILLLGARDTNMYFIPFLVLFYWFFLPKIRQKAILALGLCLIFLAFSKGADISGRWEFSLFNTVTHRILPDEKLRRTFQQKYQFPSDEHVMSCENVWASHPCPDKKIIGAWIRQYGAESYKKFLLTHPAYAFREWLKAWDEMQAELWHLDFKPVYYADESIRSKKLNPLVFNFPGNISLPMMFAVGLIGLLFLKENPLILFCLLHSLSQSFIAFHGDAMEVSRHCQQSAMTLKLALILCAIQLFLRLKDRDEVSE